MVTKSDMVCFGYSKPKPLVLFRNILEPTYAPKVKIKDPICNIFCHKVVYFFLALLSTNWMLYRVSSCAKQWHGDSQINKTTDGGKIMYKRSHPFTHTFGRRPEQWILLTPHYVHDLLRSYWPQMTHNTLGFSLPA